MRVLLGIAEGLLGLTEIHCNFAALMEFAGIARICKDLQQFAEIGNGLLAVVGICLDLLVFAEIC